MLRYMHLPKTSVSDEEIKRLADRILDFTENGAEVIKKETGSRIASYSEDVFNKQAKAFEKLKSETKLANHSIYHLSNIPNIFEDFPWLLDLYRLGEIGSENFKKYSGDILALVLRGGNYFHPHIDKSTTGKYTRDFVLNFPLMNYELSKTNFYKLKHPSRFNGSYVFPLSDILLTESVTYEKAQPTILCAKIIHSVDVSENFTNDMTRIILTSGIGINENFEAELEQMGTHPDDMTEIANSSSFFTDNRFAKS